MFKKGFFYIALILIALAGSSCSSNSGSSEDLDISEIKEIEATGEFSEDEFFSDEDSFIAEEQLIEEVPGLEAELEDEVANLEGDLVDKNLDFAEDSDLFDDIALEIDDASEGVDTKNVTVTADDLGFEENELDLNEDDATGDVASNELEFDSGDDLFRDDSTASETSTVADNNDFEQAASDLLNEDVSIDVDYSDNVAADTSALNLLNKDVSVEGYSDDIAVQTSTPKGFVSVKKMKTVPYSKNGVLINAIYFVRAGDSLRTIANQIYGNGSSVDFRIVNPHLKVGGLKIGQKVYYNSPTRSQDRSRLLTYYEDARIPVQAYSAQEGENIRTLAKTLLGHPRSWMEVWATNQQIESKAALEAPYQIRYWSGGSTLAPTLARNEAPPTPVPTPQIETPESANQTSLDLSNEVELAIPTPASVEVAAIEEEILNEPDMELDEPANVTFDEDDGFALDEEDLVAETDSSAVSANDNLAADNNDGAAVEGRDIARNQGAFPSKGGSLNEDTMKIGIIGLALLLLLAVGFLVVKRRRESQSAIEMESFDFGGETSIEEAQAKTQIDL